MKVSEAFLRSGKKRSARRLDMENQSGPRAAGAAGRQSEPGQWMYGDTLARLQTARPGVLYNDLKACNDYSADSKAPRK